MGLKGLLPERQDDGPLFSAPGKEVYSMRNSPMLDFPKEEYALRHQRLYDEMDACGVDTVIFTTQYNVRYFCGFQSVVWSSKISTPGLLIMARDGRCRLIGSRSAYETMRYTSCLTDEQLLYYGAAAAGEHRPASYLQAITGTLTEFGAAGGRVGMELGSTMRLHMNQSLYQQLRAQLPNMQPVDFTSHIWALRSVKSENEVQAMRRCAAISEAAYKKAFSSIEFGKTTEASLNIIYCAESYRQGAEREEPMIVCFGQGRYNAGNCPPSEKLITRTEHEVLLFDGGPIWRGYYSDTIREAVVGSMTERQKDYAKVSQEVLDYTLSNIKEGVNIRELMERQDAYIDRHGYGDVNRTRGWTGHGIGLEIHEPPTISADCDWDLRAGNVLAVEPTIGDDTLGHFSHEENIVVTKDGYQLISDFLPGIIVL